MQGYYVIFLLFIILFLASRQEKQQIVKRIILNKKGKGTEMLTLAEKFIGKRCLFYTFNNQISGTVKQIGQNGILIEERGEEQIINPDYIVRIREYPKNKKGKDKSVIVD